MKLLKAMATVAGLTSLSRIAGFIRDILTASILGAGPIADAFFVALKLPNLFRRITAEGAFSVSFVPMYTEMLSKQSDGNAKYFVNNTYSLMLWILTIFTVVVLVFMPFIIYIIAPGFHSDPYRFDLAIELSRITFPYLILISLSSLMGGVLNAHNKFGPYAAAPIFFNLSMIFSLLMFTPVLQTPGHALAWGVALAGIIQFLLLFYHINKQYNCIYA
jgi:putative peptidoglycan lipid II flippase